MMEDELLLCLRVSLARGLRGLRGGETPSPNLKRRGRGANAHTSSPALVSWFPSLCFFLLGGEAGDACLSVCHPLG